MGTWNHRVLAEVYPNGEVEFQIYEVYYDVDGTPNGYTANPVTVGGSEMKDLEWTLKYMKKCLKKPILFAGDRFPQEYKNENK